MSIRTSVHGLEKPKILPKISTGLSGVASSCQGSSPNTSAKPEDLDGKVSLEWF